MALFKVVLCTWGKIVGEAVWSRFSRATSGCRTQGAAIHWVPSLAYELPIADREGQRISRRSS